MKILYLLPPSEGKNSGGIETTEAITAGFKKPLEIAQSATEKDLKCKGKRYEEGITLNKNINKSEKLEAILRYSGVMYNAINYQGMSDGGRKYFNDNFKILSGMYGALMPTDMIGNYKLPIETKGLYVFWGDKITEYLNKQDVDYIIDMLPGSYAKMIDWSELAAKIVRVNFLHEKDGEVKKISHGVKAVKGKYIHNLCEKGVSSIDEFRGEKVQISENEYDINIIS